MFEVSRMFQVYVEEVSSRREGCYFFVVVGGGSELFDIYSLFAEKYQESI